MRRCGGVKARRYVDAAARDMELWIGLNRDIRSVRDDAPYVLLNLLEAMKSGFILPEMLALM